MAKKKQPQNNKPERLWVEAKRRCHLSVEDVRMAREMGLNPRSLIKNIPSKNEQWKAPVKDWIRDMYRKRKVKADRNKVRRNKAAREGESTAPQNPSFEDEN